MAIRKISKKEEVVYKLLEPHSSGRQHNFDCENVEWDEARYKYRSKKRSLRCIKESLPCLFKALLK